MEIHEKIIQKCIHHLMPSSDVLQKEASEKQTKNSSSKGTVREAALRIVRCLTVLKEYIAECDDDHGEERVILPHGRLENVLLRLFINTRILVRNIVAQQIALNRSITQHNFENILILTFRYLTRDTIRVIITRMKVEVNC